MFGSQIYNWMRKAKQSQIEDLIFQLIKYSSPYQKQGLSKCSLIESMRHLTEIQKRSNRKSKLSSTLQKILAIPKPNNEDIHLNKKHAHKPDQSNRSLSSRSLTSRSLNRHTAPQYANKQHKVTFIQAGSLPQDQQRNYANKCKEEKEKKMQLQKKLQLQIKHRNIQKEIYKVQSVVNVMYEGSIKLSKDRSSLKAPIQTSNWASGLDSLLNHNLAAQKTHDLAPHLTSNFTVKQTPEQSLQINHMNNPQNIKRRVMTRERVKLKENGLECGNDLKLTSILKKNQWQKEVQRQNINDQNQKSSKKTPSRDNIQISKYNSEHNNRHNAAQINYRHLGEVKSDKARLTKANYSKISLIQTPPKGKGQKQRKLSFNAKQEIMSLSQNYLMSQEKGKFTQNFPSSQEKGKSTQNFPLSQAKGKSTQNSPIKAKVRFIQKKFNRSKMPLEQSFSPQLLTERKKGDTSGSLRSQYGTSNNYDTIQRPAMHGNWDNQNQVFRRHQSLGNLNHPQVNQRNSKFKINNSQSNNTGTYKKDFKLEYRHEIQTEMLRQKMLNNRGVYQSFTSGANKI